MDECFQSQIDNTISDSVRADFAKWQGQCNACQAWNTLSRVSVSPIKEASIGFAGTKAQIKKLGDIETQEAQRIPTPFKELDRVLGGGLVPGSVVLMGGDPGAGKSTLLLQVCTQLAKERGVLYVTGEESLQQLAMRAQRLELAMDGLDVEFICYSKLHEKKKRVNLFLLYYPDLFQTLFKISSRAAVL